MLLFCDGIWERNPIKIFIENFRQILDVIKTAAHVKNPLSDENIEKAISKATSYGFDTKILKNAIQTLQDRLLDEL